MVVWHMLVALHVGILLVREWVCVVGFSENVTIWGCIDKLVFLVIIFFNGFVISSNIVLGLYWWLFAALSLGDRAQCLCVSLSRGSGRNIWHTLLFLTFLPLYCSISIYLSTYYISITHYLPIWLYIYLLKCPVSFKNELSLSGLCRFTLIISRIVSNEEVNMTVSVRDSPGEIRAGNSSERDDNFN